MLMRTIIGILIILAMNSILFACELEQELIKHGLVDMTSIAPSLRVEMVNASTKNMLGLNTYGCLTKCYLQPEAARKLSNAQKELQQFRPGFSLKLLDGARPLSVQKKMWKVVKGTPLQPFVADPARGSMHNYGTAVDITICDEKGRELEMGEPDVRRVVVGKSDQEIKQFLANIKLSNIQKRNRELLNRVMKNAGFHPYGLEWWHFEAFEHDHVRKNFKIIE